MIWFPSYIYTHARYFFPSYVFTRIIISLVWNYVKSERLTKYFQKMQDFNPRINPCSRFIIISDFFQYLRLCVDLLGIYFANYLRSCFNSFESCIVFLLLVFRDG